MELQSLLVMLWTSLRSRRYNGIFSTELLTFTHFFSFKCMEGCIAAITTLGGAKTADEAQRIDYIGNSNVIEQAGILGVERIILVTR